MELELLDITLPEKIPWYSFSNLTWIILFSVLSILLCFCYWFFIQRKKTKKYQLFQQVFNQLTELKNDPDISPHQLAAATDQLLKRLIISFYHKSDIQKLNNNQDWFNFLNNQLQTNIFNDQFEQIWLEGSLKPDIQFNKNSYLDQLFLLTKHLKKKI